MQNNKTKVALIYDFDETLSTQYMQDFCLIPQFGMTPDEFWAKANQWSRENGADQVTGSMYYFMKTAKEMGIRLTKENLKECGKGVIYFPGVLEWFERINRFGASLDLEIEHYIISSGYEEIMGFRPSPRACCSRASSWSSSAPAKPSMRTSSTSCAHATRAASVSTSASTPSWHSRSTPVPTSS